MSVAVKNTKVKIFAIVDEITETNKEDGVAVYLEKIKRNKNFKSTYFNLR